MTRPFGYGPEPTDWTKTNLRPLLLRRKVTGRPDLPLLSVNLPQGVVKRIEGDGRPAPAEDLSGYQVIRPGDLVMNQLGKPHGALGISDYYGIISPAYFVAEVTPLAHPRFLHWLLRTRLYISEYERRGKFMPPNQFDIGWDQFRDIGLLLPPLGVQRGIADYLDAETARIDALVAKKTEVVSLLHERAQSIVTGAWPGRLLSGRDGRPMGLDGWRCIRLGHLAKVQTGLTLDEGRETGLDPVTLPYLRVANVQDGALDLDEVKEVTVPRTLSVRCSLQPGDVLMTEGGDPDKLGRGTVWPGEVTPCLHQNHVFAVRPTAELLPEYLALITRTQYARAYFEMTASKTTGIASTSTAKIAAFRIPMASPEDQRKLVSEVMDKIDETSRLRGTVERQLVLLAEHRQALITAAVTGQFEVPGAAA